MKKFIITFIIFTIISIVAIYAYYDQKQVSNDITKKNAEFEYYYNKEIYGAELATIINKAIDSNETNNIEKDNKGKYIENDTTSINIDIKITDNDTIYNMEIFYNGGISNFVKNFNIIKFKCTNIQYHKNTNRIKYMYFEQITN